MEANCLEKDKMGRLMRKGTQRPQPQSGENRDQNHDVS